ncbi:MAG: hypothetical protein ACRED0_10130 [Gammaproteobacteria bacterium]
MIFSIDIAADCNRFITEGTPHPANPGFGDYFMQEGIIYRPGTAVQGLRLTRWELSGHAPGTASA